MKNIKKYIYALIAAILLPVASLAQNVAEVNGTGYPTLEDAIAAVPTDGTATTVKLLDNVTLTKNVVVGGSYADENATPSKTTDIAAQNVTLDLNGKNINGAYGIYLAGGTLNITGSGTIETTNSGVAPVSARFVKYTNGLDYTSKRTLTIGENVKLKGPKYGLNIFGTNEGTIVNDIDVTVDGDVEGMLFVLGNLKNTANEINIVVNGKVDASSVGENGIALNGYANLTVNNGAVVKGASGIEVRAGSLTVNGGTITATETTYSYSDNSSGTTTKGAAIAVAQHTTVLPVSVKLNGGTLEGTELIGVTDVNHNDLVGVNITADDDFVLNTATKLPAGLAWTPNGDGTYSPGPAVAKIGEDYFASLADAIAAVPTDGTAKTVTLLKDITLTENVVVGGKHGATAKITTAVSNQNVTLDLNNFNITGTKTLYQVGGTLNIIGTGTIESTNPDVAPVGIRYVKSTNGLDYTSKRTLTIGENVTLKGAQYGLNIFGTNEGTISNKIDVTVNGKIEGMLFVLGNLTNSDNEINIQINGTVDASAATGSEKVKTGIALNGNANVTIGNSAVVKGESGIEIRDGELTISGGTITATATDYSYVDNNNGTTTKGAAVAVVPYNPSREINVLINGGTLVGTKSIAVKGVSDNVVVKVSEAFAAANTTVLPEGYAWMLNSDGLTYSPGEAVATVGFRGYATFAEAAAAAIASDDVANLLKNVPATDTYEMGVGQTLKVKQNGKDLPADCVTAPENYVLKTATVGEITTFTIAKDIAKLTPELISSDWTGSEQAAPLVIKDGDYTLVAGTDYQIFQEDGNTHVDGDVFKKTDAGVYNFVVKGYGDNYGGQIAVRWNLYKNISKAPFEITIDPATYNGSDFDPSSMVHVILNLGGTTTELVENTDYTLTFKGNPYQDAKTYVDAITIQGIESNFVTGTVISNFDVLPCDIKDLTAEATVPWITGGYANGAAVMASSDFKWNVKDKGALISKTNFEVNVLDLKDAAENTIPYSSVGTYPDQVVITPKSTATNFSGTLTIPLVITPGDAIDINKCMVKSYAIYTSKNQPPSGGRLIVTYKKTDGTIRTLVKDTDYELEFNGAPESYVNAKTYSNAVKLTGKGDFYGELTTDYVIEPRDLSDKYVRADVTDPLIWTGAVQKLNVNNQVAGRTDNNVVLRLIYDGTVNVNVVPNEVVSNGEYLLKTANNDYIYTTVPTDLKEPGEYEVTFYGRYNFTGEKTVRVKLLKDIDLLTADDVEIPLQIIKGSLYPSNMQDVVIKDGDKVLERGTHYKLSILYPDGTTECIDGNTNPVAQDGKYTAVLTGLEPYYNNTKKKNFIAAYEYYAAGNNQINSNEVGIHLTSGKDLEAMVGAKTGIACDADATDITIDNKVVLTVPGDTTATFAITGIEDNAFNGTNKLHTVDATALTGYEPSTLSRKSDGPFNGIAKQALVYLAGDTPEGENYVYKNVDGDFRCDLFKVYDDNQGNQQGFEGNDYNWVFTNKYEFTANTVENTRQLNAGQHYTTCLPYALPKPESMAVYQLDAGSDQLLGFKELNINSLAEYTPYLIIPEESGQLLSTTNAVVKLTPANPTQLGANATGTGNYTMYGSMNYIGDGLTNVYLMQSGNQWKKAEVVTGFNNTCVLPMRAYIVPTTSGGAKSLTAKFFDLNGNMVVKHVDVDSADWSNAEIYDLQGRKVQTDNGNLRRGVYIINGKKTAVK